MHLMQCVHKISPTCRACVRKTRRKIIRSWFFFFFFLKSRITTILSFDAFRRFFVIFTKRSRFRSFLLRFSIFLKFLKFDKTHTLWMIDHLVARTLLKKTYGNRKLYFFLFFYLFIYLFISLLSRSHLMRKFSSRCFSFLGNLHISFFFFFFFFFLFFLRVREAHFLENSDESSLSGAFHLLSMFPLISPLLFAFLPKYLIV